MRGAGSGWQAGGLALGVWLLLACEGAHGPAPREPAAHDAPPRVDQASRQDDSAPGSPAPVEAELRRSTGEELGPSAPYTLLGAHVAGDSLLVEVRYGGGCAEHTFTFAWPGTWLESHPVQTPLLLHHATPGDPCKALVHRTLRLDLTPLRTAYQDAYRTEHATLILNLVNPQGPGLSVPYSF